MALKPMDIINARNRRLAEISGNLYLSVREVAKKYKVSRFRVLNLIRAGRIEGAYKVDHQWIIPASWKYVRRKAGRSKTFPQQKLPPRRGAFSMEKYEKELKRLQ